MNDNELAWWNGFYMGMIWLGIGLSLINLILVVGSITNNIDPQAALNTGSIANAVILISSVIMHRVVVHQEGR